MINIKYDKHKIVLFTLLVFVITGCLNNDNFISNQSDSLNLTEDELKSLVLLRSPVVSKEEAQKTLLSWVSDLQERKSDSTFSLKKKSVSLPEIESIKTLRPEQSYLTKATSTSTDIDTVPPAYLVNFKNNQGFALTSADRRIANGGVIAYVPQGNLKQGDTLKAGLDFYFGRIENFIESEKEKYKEKEKYLESALTKIIESLPDSIKNKFNQDTLKFLKKEPIINQWTTIDSIIRTIGWTYFEGKGNLLLRIVSRDQERIRNYKASLLEVTWNQWAPYNDNAPSNLGCSNYTGKPPIGCVATATAQIMSYYKEPKQINNIELDWENMKSNSYGWLTDSLGKSHIAILFRWIADEVGMNFGCNGSGTQTSSAVNLLLRQNYEVSGKQNYNWSAIVSSINDQKPVLMRGNTGKGRTSCSWYEFWCSEQTYYTGGHAWVVDGYMTRWTRTQISMEYFDESKQTIDHYVTNRYSNYNVVDYYVHVNWGWGKSANGFFHDGVLNPSNKLPVTQVNENTGTQPSNFKYNIEMWTDILHN